MFLGLFAVRLRLQYLENAASQGKSQWVDVTKNVERLMSVEHLMLDGCV